MVQHGAFLLLLPLILLGIFRALAADTNSQVSSPRDTVPWTPTMRGWIRRPWFDGCREWVQMGAGVDPVP